ncbi:MAG: hypothetical protein CVU11_03420 [Bacteroidetes bacterium HGW-Bacteroidetes-6]|jgi:hypothetical protein|nr:MAG: hypothetical protein CVU11_03420 [Bacteroidetes bacterium HGW-Bacteroidetes-6]
MKKLLILLFSIILATGLSAQTKDQAIGFNDKIVADQKKMLILEDHFITSIINDMGGDTIQLEYEIYCDFMQYTLDKYSKMKKFDKKDTFRKALIELLTNFLQVAKTEYKEMLDIYAIPTDKLTDEHYNRWTELSNIIDKKENTYNESFLDAQKAFASEYSFSLVD